MNKPLFPDIIVNGEGISQALIAAEAQNHSAPSGKPGLAWRKAARALVIRALLLQEARRKNVVASSKEVSPGKYETEEEALIRALLEEEVITDPPSEPAIQAAYDASPSLFRAATLYEPAHILFAAKPSDTETRSEAWNRANAVIELLRENPDRFAAIARDESDCPSREAGGQLGQITSGETVPEFEQALDNLRPGELATKPVSTRYGIHVVRLDAKAEGDILPFYTVKAKITESLEKLGWTKAARQYVCGLVDRADVEGISVGGGQPG